MMQGGLECRGEKNSFLPKFRNGNSPPLDPAEVSHTLRRIASDTIEVGNGHEV